MKKIDLMNEAECREHSITTARELTSAGFTVVLDDIRKIPAYLIMNKNGKVVFTAESIEGYEPWMETCKFHHIATTVAYTSVYSAGKFLPYVGRFGVGYTITVNNKNSSRYSLKYYFISEEKTREKEKELYERAMKNFTIRIFS